MQYKKIQKNNYTKGFSLVEMLVAIGIFMTIMTVAISSLISIIGANKKAQAIKGTIDSVTFALESISKDMRIGSYYKCSKDGISFSPTDCISSGENIGGPAVSYINSDNKTVQYVFSTDEGKDILSKQIIGVDSNPIALISRDSNVNITNMKFYVIGADHEFDTGSTKTQPRVVITASGLISEKGSAATSFNLQTNISQRIRR